MKLIECLKLNAFEGIRDLDFCGESWECTGDSCSNKQKKKQLSTSKTAVSPKRGNLSIIPHMVQLWILFPGS